MIYKAIDTEQFFLYGTIINKETNCVVLENNAISPGKTLYEWNSSSRLNKNSKFIIPSLPILQYNHKYRLKFKIIANPKNSILLRINFFDIQKNIIDSYSCLSDFEFVYPRDTYAYSISLIQMHSFEVKIYYIEIENV